MRQTLFSNLEGDGHSEYGLALLYCNNTPCGEAATITNTVNLVQNRYVFIARSEKVAVQAVGLAVFVYSA